jgi:hypothetical protein
MTRYFTKQPLHKCLTININGEPATVDIDISKPQKRDDAPGTGKWYKWHDIALLLKGKLIGRVVVETISLTINGSAQQSFWDIDEHFATDWELPLTFFEGHNLSPQLLEFSVWLDLPKDPQSM